MQTVKCCEAEELLWHTHARPPGGGRRLRLPSEMLAAAEGASNGRETDTSEDRARHRKTDK